MTANGPPGGQLFSPVQFCPCFEVLRFVRLAA